MLSLYMWFCDHSEWWVVWVCCSTFGGGFGLVGGQVDIHIRVCMSNPVIKGCVQAPPTVRSREQVAVAKFLLADTFG